MSTRSRRIGDSALAARLTRELEGEVLFDAFSRGLYSTDASIYQIEPVGVVVPKRIEDVHAALAIASDEGVPVVPRGGGTSQSGQAIGEALIVDTSKHLTGIGELDREGRTIRVEPGVVLDRLNQGLRPHGLFFPVDVATASQATLGGMAGNNSAGARSIRFGMMVDNVLTVEAVLAGGEPVSFGAAAGTGTREAALASAVGAIRARVDDELLRRMPDVMRNVAGYNLARTNAEGEGLADLLVGSEGTLAFFTSLTLQLQPVPVRSALGVCHFPTLHDALESVRHIVALEPTAVELLDAGLIDLARSIPAFRDAVARFVRGAPRALLLVEFTADEPVPLDAKLSELQALLGDLGFPDAVVPATDPGFQREIWSVRRASMNVVMSMKGDGKPVSFIEDCTVPLEHLADYGDRLTEVFQRHGTEGTWYAHASVGCLHVRPTLNLKSDVDLKKMRVIAEEAHELVREFGGSHSGEHGDGLVRSEFLEPMLGSRLVRAFEEVKLAFDPQGLMNPGKIVRPSLMDDRSLMRYGADYAPVDLEPALDWSEWGGLCGAVEMCTNNGACRKSDPGVMCPSYRVTRDERDTTRGRANALRLALTGQLGPDALTSQAMRDVMSLCVGCKACRRECPTGVDMARMKVEFLHHYNREHGLGLRDRLMAYLPRYAPWASRLAGVLNARNGIAALRSLMQTALGVSARRRLPAWRRDPYREHTGMGGPTLATREAVLFVDTFTRYFEPENAHAAARVLGAAGYRTLTPRAADGGRPLCCGRTFLSQGLVDEARIEAGRMLVSLGSYANRGIPIVGLEPSCLLTLRDEFPALLDGDARVLADNAFLLEELLVRVHYEESPRPALSRLAAGSALVHGHCHEKAHGTEGTVAEVLGWIPELDVTMIESSCCGMAGSFGYEAEHVEISEAMAELSLLPAVRRAGPDTRIVANGFSCRHQITEGTGRSAVHAVRLLDEALEAGTSTGNGRSHRGG